MRSRVSKPSRSSEGAPLTDPAEVVGLAPVALKHLRGLVPRRPGVRIVLLLVVAGVAIGVAGALFAGGETTASDPAVAGTETAPSADEPSASPAASPPAGTPGVAPDGTAEDASNATTGVDPEASPAAGPSDATGTPAPAAPAPSPAPAAATADGPAGTDAAQPAAGPGPEDAAAELVERLRPLVAAPDPDVPAYDRDYFAGWLDTDGDCVNTRHEVLQIEAYEHSMNAAGCAVAAGEWFDPYTNRTFTNPRDLDVDHVVALADAWVSGAWRWADELLDRFSNDLGNLNAIAAGENRSKSAKGPSAYSPTAPAGRCDYLVQYATVKIDWQLTITPQDFAVVADGLAGCEVGELPESPSPPTAGTSPTPPPASPPPASPPPAATDTDDCHPAYEPCLPNLPGDALNCGDLSRDQRPVTVLQPGTDPYRFDRDGDGRGCTS